MNWKQELRLAFHAIQRTLKCGEIGLARATDAQGSRTMTQRIRWIWILALIATAGCGKKDRQVVAPQTHDVSAVSVWVNDTGITTMDIQAEVQRLFKPMASVIREEQIPAIRVRLIEQAVNRLVVRQLIQDEMARSGILISQAEIEAAKAELEKELGQGESLAMILASANQTIENLEMEIGRAHV
jgi:hypothetical protein